MSRFDQQNALKPILALLAAIYLCTTAAGCGYSFASARFSDNYRTLAVPAFKNKTFEEELQIRVTNALIRELEADGRFQIINDPATADLVLKGAITNFKASAISFGTNDNIDQFNVILTASATLEEGKTGKVLWHDDKLTGRDFYEARGGHTRENALDQATRNLVENLIYDCFDSNW